jgi:L-alanine-DL-glutamate epimerase-like enolase superfamily enzyme
MIKKVETFHQKHLCVVRLTTDDGMVGWGQTAHMNADISCQI